jgi:radical SAM superfamily enzyme YgiQ (UPF0313 family)
MSESTVTVTLRKGLRIVKVDGVRVAFSVHRCFAFDDGLADVGCLRALGKYLEEQRGLAIYGAGRFVEYLLKHVPALRDQVVCLVVDGDASGSDALLDVPTVPVHRIPANVKTVFLGETLYVRRQRMRRRLPREITVIDPEVLAELAPEVIPNRAWTPVVKHIYPIDLPEIQFDKGLDLILIDCPSRNLALMPNGLAYVSNALKNSEVSYQVFDLDIVAYHRFHMHRLFDAGGRVVLPSGRVMPEDPWQAEHYDVWTSASEMATTRHGHRDVIDFFRPLIDETVNALVTAAPKILGLSVQQCNEAISQQIVRGVKSKLPEIVVVVGGFSCYNADIGRRIFPDCDYMCVGEADLTVAPLIEALARGERPANVPGVMSRFDRADYRFIPAPMVHDLDQIEFPKYEWCDLKLYRNFNGYQLTPIIASRGCRWSRCTFCAERFYWRIRSPQNFVDELEWLVDNGCYLYMFNESDLNGMPERVMEICDEIVHRGLHRKVKLTGQLRIHKKSDRVFFEKLREANFVALRFGVDAFSANTLKLQKKGYTVDMVSQNLRDCWESGIYTEVNWVIGVPGETDADVVEGIDLILKNRQYIGRLANINPLILVNGGVYWLDPEAHNIKFRAPKDELYAKYPRAIPADYWYSAEPYIDAQVRKERFEKIVLALHDAGFPIGAWAAKIIEDVKLARDPNRAGGTQAETGIQGELDDRRNAKPAATPPLFRVAGEPPRLVRRLEHHDIVFFDGWYYGVPAYATSGDVAAADPSKLSGTIKHTTEEGVLAEIEKASEFANSRGRYDAQSDQQSDGPYMRVDSALGEGVQSQLPDQITVLRYKNGELIAVAQERLKKAFDANPSIDERSPLRKVAARLPRAIQQELRRLVRGQTFKEGQSSVNLILRSDKQMLGLLWRGALNAYVKQPASHLLGKGNINDLGVQNSGIQIAGEEFSILSVVTKNAVPELMWSLGGYNLVKFDGVFYGLPHGHAVNWDEDDVTSMPNVITARTVDEVVSQIETRSQAVHSPKPGQTPTQRATGPAGESSRVPMLQATLGGYNIVAYEGWVYGIPHSLGPLDLTEVDLIGMPGVIRDVSRDVVENEVLDRIKVAEGAGRRENSPSPVGHETTS